MLKRLSSAMLTAALLTASDAALSAAWAKPHDLPVDVKNLCQPATSAPGTEQGDANDSWIQQLRARELDPDYISCQRGPQIDAVTPLLSGIWQAMWDSMPFFGAGRDVRAATEFVPAVGIQDLGAGRDLEFDPAGEFGVEIGMHVPFTTTSRCGEYVVTRTPCSTQVRTVDVKQDAAARLYQIGTQCQARGDTAMARNCFEEVTRVCPDCAYARMAAHHLAAVKAGQQGGGTEESEPADRDTIRESRADLRRIAESRHMLQVAEKYRAAGEMDKAFRCYQEAHMVCPACRHGQQALEQMLRITAEKTRGERNGGVEEQEPATQRGPAPRDLQRREEARALYQLGERCRRNGDDRMAYNFYEETHLACPDCYYGVRAIERMHEIETRSQRTAPDGGEWR